jgi:hypothetical protein
MAIRTTTPSIPSRTGLPGGHMRPLLAAFGRAPIRAEPVLDRGRVRPDVGARCPSNRDQCPTVIDWGITRCYGRGIPKKGRLVWAPTPLVVAPSAGPTPLLIRSRGVVMSNLLTRSGPAPTTPDPVIDAPRSQMRYQVRPLPWGFGHRRYQVVDTENGGVLAILLRRDRAEDEVLVLNTRRRPAGRSVHQPTTR